MDTQLWVDDIYCDDCGEDLREPYGVYPFIRPFSEVWNVGLIPSLTIKIWDHMLKNLPQHDWLQSNQEILII